MSGRKTKAMVHSRKSLNDVIVINETDKNNMIVQYKDNLCTATFNPINGTIYVDDIYGIVKNLNQQEQDNVVLDIEMEM